ncbi:molybdopterin-binding protein [Amaricoccus tamworthensis]|uniref:molybdopterin-binding protein n=1 Tax=Amaricoccus tamworthensis TaxID=57002 RepID=UPI003C7DB7B3
MNLRNDCFALPPGVDWVPVDDALSCLRDAITPIEDEEIIPLSEAGGRIATRDVLALRSHPPGANSAVDGYGFAHEALDPRANSFTLPLVEGRAAAGVPFRGTVPPGSAIRILTGALVPPGVDTVVLEEDVTVADGHVHIPGRVKPGSNTRAAGEDKKAGEGIFPAGTIIRSTEIGAGVATGIAQVRVRRRLRVGVLSTGDEVVPAGRHAKPHMTFDANRPMLMDLVRAWNMEPVDLGHVRDDGALVAEALDCAIDTTDAVLTSGGASQGDEDHVSKTLRERGSLNTWRIAVKPGRPLALGMWSGFPVFGLPGNPVAAFVCALIFARPALFRLGGADWLTPQGYMLPAGFSKNKKPGRREFLRARIGPDGHVEVFPSEGSGRVSGLSWAQGLVELEDGAREVRPGDRVRYIPFSEFGL